MMDETLRHNNPNPFLKANWLSKMTFWWMNPVFKKGSKGWLEEADMYNVCPSDVSTDLGQKLQSHWERELQKGVQGKEPSLARALIRTCGLQILLVSPLVFIEPTLENELIGLRDSGVGLVGARLGTSLGAEEDRVDLTFTACMLTIEMFRKIFLQLAQPIFLSLLLGYFTPDRSVTRSEAWIYATCLVLCTVIGAVIHHPLFFILGRAGMRLRVSVCSVMFKKCLRLSNKSLNEASVGQIVNLMSNDVSRFEAATIFIHDLWAGPLQAIAALVILWYEVGISVLAGLAPLLLLMPAQGLMGRVFSTLRRKTAVHTDKRVKVMNEIISGIRIIKMYCWENPFRVLVEKLRSLEIRQLRRTRHVQSLIFAPYFTSAQASFFLLFLAFTLSGRGDEMDSSTVFLTMGLIHTIKNTCAFFLPMGCQQLAELVVVIRRVQTFLLLEEKTPPTCNVAENGSVTYDKLRTRGNADYNSLELKNVTARWDTGAVATNTLKNIEFSVGPRDLVAVIGPVGSGKTSVLMSILGELPLQSGTVAAHGKIAYVSQHPWVFSGSVRQNIVFGAEFDTARYNEVIKICALTKDLSLLPKGDATLIGERGVTLSGGQRARVSLARALYMDADIYLLDDPLAAVDTAVGRHIFEKCVVKHLKDKPRILVTHQAQILPVADNVVIVTDGKITGQGTFTELAQSGVDFSELLKRSDEQEEEWDMQGEVHLNLQNSSTSGPGIISSTRNKSLSKTSLDSTDSMEKNYVPEPVQLPEEEEREKGSLGYSVYVEYFKAGTGVFKFVFVILLLVLAQVLYIMNDWWLGRWSDKVEDRHAALEKYDQFLIDHNVTDVTNINTSGISVPDVPEVDSYFNLYVLAGLVAALLLSAFIRALLFFAVTMQASKVLHNRMFASILRTQTSFFDTNPVGRVLNRFSKDVGQIDDLLPWTMFDFIQNALAILGTVVVGCVFNPWVFIPAVPLAVLFFVVRSYYLKTSRSIKRLEGTTRSPVFSHLSASLQGIHTIRAMRMEQRLVAEFDSHQDLHTQAWFLFLSANRWLAVRLDTLSALFILSVTFGSVLAVDSVDASLIGISVVYAMQMMNIFQWTVRQSAELENQMISVERVLQYTRLPLEAELESEPGQKPPPSWPTQGALHAQGVSLQYSPTGPYVLNNINFHIRGGEKIGIVGRTGAGKSSLISTLFRMVEPQGTLLIDGVNIQDIGLHDLRGSISIIPQDPVLFTGSIRRNLDPFQEYSDAQLWQALEEVQLKESIRATSEGLYMEVNERGTNFSAGQRQLMCLARAVLGHTRILIIDEATANVDPLTDELIQQTIRTKFQQCTVLTIAHRLHTIIDSHRVMVLDAGEVVELDTPCALLSKGSGGTFYGMVEQLGTAELEHLTRLAATTGPARPPSSENDYALTTCDCMSHSVFAEPPAVIGNPDGTCSPGRDFSLETGHTNVAFSFTPETTRL